jgi:hypothetical protein
LPPHHIPFGARGPPAAKRITRSKATAAFVCPVPVISVLAYVAFFNNIAPRQTKKGLRATGIGFTTKH